MTPRAQWAQDAVDLRNTPEKVPYYLTVGQLSDATGLSQEYLLDPLTRRPITNKANPLSALCRPQGRFGAEPMWATSQLAKYQELARKAEEAPELEMISAKEARERNLHTTAELAERLQVHDQTLRRAQKNDETYPPALARLSREGRPGVPEHLRDLAAMMEWAKGRGYAVPSGLLASA